MFVGIIHRGEGVLLAVEGSLTFAFRPLDETARAVARSGSRRGGLVRADLPPLEREAIRLALQQEQSHGHDDSKHHAAAPAHDRGHAHVQAGRAHAGSLRACRPPAGGIPQALARHVQCRGPSELPASPGRHGHLADNAQRHDHGLEVLLRRDAVPARTHGQDAPGAGAANSAGRAQPRGSSPPDRLHVQPEAPGGAVAGLWHGTARQRDRLPEGERRGQPAHGVARRAGQGTQGSLRHAQPRAARTAAAVVAPRPCPRQDSSRRLVVPRHGSDGAADHQAAQPGGSRRRRDGQDRQARHHPHAAPLFRVQEYAETGRRGKGEGGQITRHMFSGHAWWCDWR